MSLKISQNPQENTCVEVSLLKSCRLRAAALLKRGFITGVFLWILRNFLRTYSVEHLQTDAFWIFCVWKHNDPEKQRSIIFNESVLWSWNTIILNLWKLTKLKKQSLYQIASSTNNLVWLFKKIRARRGSLVHEAGHVNWMRKAAC